MFNELFAQYLPKQATLAQQTTNKQPAVRQAQQNAHAPFFQASMPQSKRAIQPLNKLSSSILGRY